MDKLRIVMEKLISYSMIASICGFNIYDEWITTSKVEDGMKINRGRLIFTLDFEKAYNWFN